MPGGGPLPVLVEHRAEAEAALELAGRSGLEIELVMAAGVLGPAAIKALETLLGRPITVLCDDRPGLALEALRAGLRQLVLEPATGASGDAEAYRAAAARLADIARPPGDVGKPGGRAASCVSASPCRSMRSARTAGVLPRSSCRERLVPVRSLCHKAASFLAPCRGFER